MAGFACTMVGAEMAVAITRIDLVPCHRGFDGLSEAGFQLGQVIFMHQDDDAPWRSWLS